MHNNKPVVMWIEDHFDLDMNEILSYLKETNKYDLVIANDQETAEKELNRSGRAIPSLIILDIILPTGSKVAGSYEDDILGGGIRFYDKHIKPRRIKTLVLSCRDDEDAVNAFEGDENVVYLLKPVWPYRLEERLDDLLEQELKPNE